jgi:uncharacterized protein (DUF1697 family)
VATQGWVALLRAVNLGARNRVPMAELRGELWSLGFSSVSTYIASGNVLFVAEGSRRESIAQRIEAVIGKSFGVETAVVLRKPDELRRLLAGHPFGETSSSYVTFLAAKPPPAAVRALGALDFGADEVKVAGSDVYLRYPNGVTGAQATSAALERALGVPGTARNWRTVTKLAELAEELG